MRVWIIGTIAAVTVVAAFLSDGRSTPRETPLAAKARRDETVLVHKDDAAMLRARERSRATLDQFLALNESRPPNSRAYAVKIPVRDGDAVEWLWIADFAHAGDRFHGRIDNTPRTVRSVAQGQRIDFHRTEIGDWMYVRDGRIKGNFTACALLDRESAAARADFLRRFQMDCDA